MTDRCEPPPELRGVDGWHWVRSIGNIGSELLFWGGRYGRWQNDAGDEVYLADGRWFYTSPVATPAEVEALRAERDRLETTALNAAGQVDNLRAVAAAAQAELATLRARVAELEGALRGIARQHLVAEMQADDVANADWHFANDVIVGIARAALSPTPKPAQGEP